jgi:Predicted SAM-dependent methyltransferase
MSVIITSAPEATDIALRELRQVAGELGEIVDLDDGVSLVEVHDPIALADALASSPPTFIRHIAPADIRVELQGDEHDIQRVAEAAETLLAALPERFLKRPHAVQVRLSYRIKQPYTRYAIAAPLRAHFERYGPEDVRHPEVVLSVYWGVNEAFLGVWPVSHCLSDWAGGERRYAITPDQISRAEFKLLEAIEVFKLDLPSSGRALDFGAAPGGWTRILVQRGYSVIAVDPAYLDKQVVDLKNVRHWQGKAEEFLDLHLRNKQPWQRDRFDLIVNDMRLDARDSARLMVEAVPLLQPNGLAIVTLKLPYANLEQVYLKARSILEEGYEIIGSRQLFHNRSEVTVALRLPSAARESEEH